MASCMGGEASGEWPFDTPPHVFELYVSLQKTLDYTGTWDGTINPVELGVEMPETFTKKMIIEIMGNYQAMAWKLNARNNARKVNPAPAPAPAPAPEEEEEEERAAKQQKTIVINQYGELIGELTSLERAIYQHGCSTCDPHTAGCCSGCVSLRKKGLLE